MAMNCLIYEKKLCLQVIRDVGSTGMSMIRSCLLLMSPIMYVYKIRRALSQTNGEGSEISMKSQFSRYLVRADGSNTLTIRNGKLLLEFCSTHLKKPVPEYDLVSVTRRELGPNRGPGTSPCPGENPVLFNKPSPNPAICKFGQTWSDHSAGKGPAPGI